MNNGSAKLLLIGVGAILAFAQFGPLGIILLGVVVMAFEKN